MCCAYVYLSISVALVIEGGLAARFYGATALLTLQNILKNYTTVGAFLDHFFISKICKTQGDIFDFTKIYHSSLQ